MARIQTLGSRVAAVDTRSAPPAPKTADSFYRSQEWRDLLDQIIAERGRRCEDPKHDASRPREGIRIFGDHIVEIRDGGAMLEPCNVMLRCGSCHSRKTAEMRARRSATRY